MSLPVREGLVLHRIRATVGVIVQHILLQTEPRHIAAVLVASGRALFRRIGRFVCQGMLPLRIVPADKHTAFSRHSRRAARRAGLGIERLIDRAFLHGDSIIFFRSSAIQLDRAERSRFRRVEDGHIGQSFPLGVERHFSLVFNRLGKRCAVAVKVTFPGCPTVKGIPLALKLIWAQIT